MSLIRAKQHAFGCTGQNFYVTDAGIKRDFNLLGGKYEFKVYNNHKAVIVENKEGKIIEKISLSQDVPDTANVEASANDKPKGGKKLTNSK